MSEHANSRVNLPLNKLVIFQKGEKPVILRDEPFESSVPYLDINAIENGIIRQHTHSEVSLLADENDILVVWDGGRSGYAFKGKYGAIGSTLMLLRSSSLLSEYLYFFIKSKYEYINNNTVGSSVSHVNSDLIFNLKIPFLPLIEQAAVVEDLNKKYKYSTLLIEKHKKAVKETLVDTKVDFEFDTNDMVKSIQKFRQSVLQKAVRGELIKNKIIIEQNKSHVDHIQLGDVINTIEAGKSFRCIERPPENNEVGVLKISAVTWGIYNEDESKTCIEKFRINKDLYIKKGDFLISRANTKELVGACVIADKVTKNIMLNDKVLRINFKDNLVYPKYVLFFLQSIDGRTQIESFASGSQDSMKNITQSDIKGIKIPCPSLEFQKTISDRIEELFKVADKVQKEYKIALEHFNDLEKSVLQQAFNKNIMESKNEEENLNALLSVLSAEREDLERKQKIARAKRTQFINNNFIKSNETEKIKNKIKEISLNEFNSIEYISPVELKRIRDKLSESVENLKYDDFYEIFQQMAQNQVDESEDKPFFIAVNNENKLVYKLNKNS